MQKLVSSLHVRTQCFYVTDEHPVNSTSLGTVQVNGMFQIFIFQEECKQQQPQNIFC